jgi:diketogulonate reductase-like aldo/keto reductase
MLTRIIPSSGERLPVIGIGTWKTFDVDAVIYPDLKNVLATMYSAGARVIDSSPMYGKAEKAVGDITAAMPVANDFFYATKIWTTGLLQGIQQIEASMQKMQRSKMDLVQIHNLTDWKTHLPQLRRMKEAGIIRYIGITHYTDASHDELERVLLAEKLDFVQFNYSIASRHAEKRLLKVTASRGIATIINRPFGVGKLFASVNGRALPPWAGELGINSWAAFFLKYILAHPAVTCVIPATGNPEHAADNFIADVGILPDEKMKNKMLEYLNIQ